MSTSTFANGETLTSTALTPDAMATAVQSLVAQALGLDPAIDPDRAFAAVRIEWPHEGQPGWGIGEDVCFVRAVPQDDAFSRVRDELPIQGNADMVPHHMAYTQVWNIGVICYGPNAFDHARLLLTCLSLDWLRNALKALNLYPLPLQARPVYAPEPFQGRWWKRASIEIEINEQVFEIESTAPASSMDVDIITDTGATQIVRITT